MFLIAPGAQELASWNGADRETKAKQANRKGYFAETFSQKEERHEYDTTIKNVPVHLYRQMAPKILFSLKRDLIDTGSCGATSEASLSECLPEPFAILNPPV